MEKRELVIRRVIDECWDSMEVPATCVKAFTAPTTVHNFAIRKLCVLRLWGGLVLHQRMPLRAHAHAHATYFFYLLDWVCGTVPRDENVDIQLMPSGA
jgi:hypothetical protein